MPSVLKRSGVAVVKVVEYLEWKPELVFQVGIGHFHKEAEVMKAAWPDVPFVGCEPHPEVIDELRKVYPGIIHQCAISDKSGTQVFYDKKRHQDGSSLWPDLTRPNSKQWDVRVESLDRFNAANHTLLWLDCEGSELNALIGGPEFLKSVDVINLEMTTNPPRPGWCDLMELHYWLVQHGYKRQTAHTHRTGGGQCDAIYVKRHLWRREYCTCPCSLMDT